MACRMWIRASGGKSAARRRRSGALALWECRAAPLRAVPGAVGKGPTLEETGPLTAECGSEHHAAWVPPAVGGAGLGECEAAPFWARAGCARSSG